MPKVIDYPYCSFQDALEIAKIVNKVGGRAPLGLIAEELKLKETGGGFQSKINGATKYGFLKKEGKQLILTTLADKYFHPIKSSDKEEALRESFESVPVFKEILEKCTGQHLTKSTLESILVRMLNVNRNVASKVAWYFFKANDLVHFLEKDGNKLIIPKKSEEKINESEERVEEKIDTNEIKKEICSLDKDLFDLILNLGNLLNNQDKSSQEVSLSKIKEIVSNNNGFSHSELFLELLTIDNPKIIEKFKEAIMKDLSIG